MTTAGGCGRSCGRAFVGCKLGSRGNVFHREGAKNAEKSGRAFYLTMKMVGVNTEVQPPPPEEISRTRQDARVY